MNRGASNVFDDRPFFCNCLDHIYQVLPNNPALGPALPDGIDLSPRTALREGALESNAHD
jgi:hypothetical protein